MLWFIRVREFIDKNSAVILWLAIITYAVIFSLLTLKKLDLFLYNAYDLAIFNQVFWNTLHGDWLNMTINANSYLADHFTPILFLFLPIYWLKPGPELLLILQSCLLALAAWPLYAISRLILQDKFISLGIGLLWLFNPVVHSINFYEFHLETVLAFLILWVFYFYQREKLGLFLLFFCLSLLVREDAAIAMIGFSFLAILDKRSWQWILIPGLLAIVYFIFAIKLISFFSPIENYKFLVYYQWAGGDSLLTIIWSWFKQPLEFLRHLFNWHNLNFFILFLPLCFLPLLKPKYLILIILPALQIFLTSSGFSSFVAFSHYAVFFLPALFIAFIFSVEKVQQSSRILRENKAFLGIVFLVTTFYFLFTLSPASAGFQPNHYFKGDYFVNNIGLDSKVAVSDNLAPLLSSRSEIYLVRYAYVGRNQFSTLPWQLPPVDYILIDWQSFFQEIYRANYDRMSAEQQDRIAVNWQSLLSNYSLIEAKDGIYLFKAKDQQEFAGYPLLAKAQDINGLAEQTASKQGLILADRLAKQGDFYQLQIVYDSSFIDSSKSYLIRFYRQDNTSFDLPLDYGLLPTRLWPVNQPTSFYYYLNPQEVVGYQIFSWSEFSKALGKVNEVVFNMKTEPASDLRKISQ